MLYTLRSFTPSPAKLSCCAQRVERDSGLQSAPAFWTAACFFFLLGCGQLPAWTTTCLGLLQLSGQPAALVFSNCLDRLLPWSSPTVWTAGCPVRCVSLPCRLFCPGRLVSCEHSCVVQDYFTTNASSVSCPVRLVTTLTERRSGVTSSDTRCSPV